MTLTVDFERFCADALGETLSPAWAALWRGVDRLAMRNDTERALWRSLYGRDELPDVSPSQIVLVKGRRAGGTKTSCKRLIYRIHTGDFRRYVTRGERIHCIVTAQDRATSYEIMAYFRLFYESPMLQGEVVSIYRNAILLKNNWVIDVRTNNFRAQRGVSCGLGNCDETGVWRAEGVGTDREVLRALIPAMVQFPERELHIIGTPWVAEGILHEAATNPFARPDRAVFTCPTALMVQGQSNAAAIESQLAIEKEADPQAYAREFECAWLADLSAFLADSDIAAARQHWHELPHVDGVTYYATADASALTGGDRFTHAFFHVAEGVTVVDALRGKRRGTVAETCDEIASLCKAYRVETVTVDQYAYVFLAELMRQRGVALEQLAFSARNKPEIFLDLKNALAQGTFQIPDNNEALRELRALQSLRTSGGSYKIGAPRGGHDDYPTVLALAAHRAKRSSRPFHCPEVIELFSGPEPRTAWRDPHEGLTPVDSGDDRWYRPIG